MSLVSNDFIPQALHFISATLSEVSNATYMARVTNKPCRTVFESGMYLYTGRRPDDVAERYAQATTALTGAFSVLQNGGVVPPSMTLEIGEFNFEKDYFLRVLVKVEAGKSL
jgi:hypothetical protein